MRTVRLVLILAMGLHAMAFVSSTSGGARFTAETRPDHSERLQALKAELAANVFEKSAPAETARYGILGCLNQQLAISQNVGLPSKALEAAIGSPFSLGYIFASSLGIQTVGRCHATDRF